MGFSPDGSRIVTASFDKTAKVWDAKTGAEVHTLKGLTDVVSLAMFSPDGSRIVTASQTDKTSEGVGRQDRHRGPHAQGAHRRRLFGVVQPGRVAGRHRRVRTANSEGVGRQDRRRGFHSQRATDARLRRRSARTGRGSSPPLVTEQRRCGTSRLAPRSSRSTSTPIFVSSASFSPDGSRIVTASDDEYGEGVGRQDRRRGPTLKGHTGGVSSASFSPDGSRIVTADVDKTAKVWDAKTGAEVLTLKGHTGGVSSACSARTGRGSSPPVTTDGEGLGRQELGRGPHARGADRVRLSVVQPGWVADRHRGKDGTAKVWDAKTGAELCTLKGHTGRVLSACSARTGRGSLPPVLTRWRRFGTPRPAPRSTRSKGTPVCISLAVFSPDGSRIVTPSYEDKTAKVWDAKNCAEFLTLDGQTFAGWEHRDKTARLMGRLSAQWVSLSPDGSRFVAADYDKYDKKKVAKVGDARTGAEELSLKGHTDRIISASFSPDGSRIVTASVDGRLKVWDPKTGIEVLSLKGHTGVEWSASFSPDGLRIGTSSKDGTAKMWDATPISREFLETGDAPPMGTVK